MSKVVVQRADLFCKAGSKDAVYEIEVLQVDGGYTVEYRNGRAGSTLAGGSKTPNGPVPLEAAQKVFDKVVREKLKSSPPYQYSSDVGEAFTRISAEMAQRSTGLTPQLLREIEPHDTQEIEAHLRSPLFGCEQKHDGERRIVKVESAGGRVIGSNRRGLEVPLPVTIASAALRVNAACVIDGEIVGSTLYAFDLLELNGADLRNRAFAQRKEALEGIADRLWDGIKVIKTAHTEADKRALLETTKGLGQEGVVFKRMAAPYSEPQRKLKHWKDATVIVLGANGDRRSVRMGVLGNGENNAEVIEVGSVTIPSNAAVPQEGSLIDVTYLYAFDGGSLFQPIFKGVRTDLERSAAAVGRLKFKVEHADA